MFSSLFLLTKLKRLYYLYKEKCKDSIMGQGINQIATELEARTIGGSTASYTDNKCVTKLRAAELSCSVDMSVTNYTDDQLVKYADLSRLLLIEDYENKVCVLSVYNTAGQRHLLSGYPLKDSSGTVVEKNFYTRNTFQDPLELSNVQYADHMFKDMKHPNIDISKWDLYEMMKWREMLSGEAANTDALLDSLMK